LRSLLNTKEGILGKSLAEDTDDLFVGKTLLHGDVLMWLMKTLLTSGVLINGGAGHSVDLAKSQIYTETGSYRCVNGCKNPRRATRADFFCAFFGADSRG
jgi:hypothetical protein